MLDFNSVVEWAKKRDWTYTYDDILCLAEQFDFPQDITPKLYVIEFDNLVKELTAILDAVRKDYFYKEGMGVILEGNNMELKI